MKPSGVRCGIVLTGDKLRRVLVEGVHVGLCSRWSNRQAILLEQLAGLSWIPFGQLQRIAFTKCDAMGVHVGLLPTVVEP